MNYDSGLDSSVLLRREALQQQSPVCVSLPEPFPFSVLQLKVCGRLNAREMLRAEFSTASRSVSNPRESRVVGNRPLSFQPKTRVC